jgi:hypothetical protein
LAPPGNHPPDLINVALERLLQAGLESPAFSTLDGMESKIHGEVKTQIFKKIWIGWAGTGGRCWPRCWWRGRTARVENRLKKAARRATWSKFKDQAAHLEWVKRGWVI